MAQMDILTTRKEPKSLPPDTFPGLKTIKIAFAAGAGARARYVYCPLASQATSNGYRAKLAVCIASVKMELFRIYIPDIGGFSGKSWRGPTAI